MATTIRVGAKGHLNGASKLDSAISAAALKLDKRIVSLDKDRSGLINGKEGRALVDAMAKANTERPPGGDLRDLKDAVKAARAAMTESARETVLLGFGAKRVLEQRKYHQNGDVPVRTFQQCTRQALNEMVRTAMAGGRGDLEEKRNALAALTVLPDRVYKALVKD